MLLLTADTKLSQSPENKLWFFFIVSLMFVVLQSWLLKLIQKQPKVKIQRLFLHSLIFNIFSSPRKKKLIQACRDWKAVWSSLCASRDTGGLYERWVNAEEGILSSPKDFELGHWPQQTALLGPKSSGCKGHTRA